MKLKFKKLDLANGLNIVSKAVPTRATMPILECIYIEAEKNTIKFTSNDLEFGIETEVPGIIEKEGRSCIEARSFIDLVSKINGDEEQITVNVNDKFDATIEGKGIKYKILSKDPELFEKLPKVGKSAKISISESSLKQMIEQTIFSINPKENKQILKGGCFESKDGKFKITTCDNIRISIRIVELKDKGDNFNVIVPRNTLQELMKILSDDTNSFVNIYVSDNHISFEYKTNKLVSRLIDGTYIDVQRVIVKDYSSKIEVDRAELIEKVEAATPIIKEGDNKPIILELDEDKLKIRVETLTGEMDTSIDVVKSGKNITIGQNPKFLLDVLRNIKNQDTVNIYFGSATDPCFIKNEEETYFYLIAAVSNAH